MIGDMEFGRFAEQFIGDHILHGEAGEEFSAGAEEPVNIFKRFFTVFDVFEGTDADNVIEGFILEGDIENTSPGDMSGDIFQTAKTFDGVVLEESIDADDEVGAFRKFGE